MGVSIGGVPPGPAQAGERALSQRPRVGMVRALACAVGAGQCGVDTVHMYMALSLGISIYKYIIITSKLSISIGS